MKKFFLALSALLCISFPAVAQLVPVTGNLNGINGTASLASSNYLQVALVNCGNTQASVNGVAVMVNGPVQLYPAANGTFQNADGTPALLYGNDAISCGSIGNTSRYAIVQYIGGQPAGPTQYYFIQSGTTFNINTAVPISVLPPLKYPNPNVCPPGSVQNGVNNDLSPHCVNLPSGATNAVIVNPADTQLVNQPSGTFTRFGSVSASSAFDDVGNLYAGVTGFAPGGMVDARSFVAGAKCNFAATAAAATVSASNLTQVTFATPILDDSITGKTIVIHNPSGNAVVSVLRYVSATTAALSSPAPNAITSQWAGIGFDDTAAIQAAVNYDVANGYATVYIPTAGFGRSCLVTQSINAGDASALYFQGDTINHGFNKSTITHALTEHTPVLDFSGSGRSGIVNLAIIPANNDNSNSQASNGFFAMSAAGGQSPLYTDIIDSTINAGSVLGDAACVLQGNDFPRVYGSNCTGGASGLVMGNGFGSAVVHSKFYTSGGGFGATLCTVQFSSDTGGIDTPMQLEGCQRFLVNTNSYTAYIGATGKPNGCIISLDAVGAVGNFFEFDGRTENQSPGATGVTSICLNSTAGGSISGELNGHASGGDVAYAIGGAGTLNFYNVNISSNVNTLFNNLNGMFSTNLFVYPHSTPPNFGTILAGSQGFGANRINSFYTAAQIKAGVPASDGTTQVCTASAQAGCETLGNEIIDGSLSAGSAIIQNQASIGGSASVSGTVGIGNLSNAVRNSHNFGASTWTVTGSPTLTAAPDGYGGNTGTKIVTSAATTFVDSNTTNPLLAMTYATCAHIKSSLGTETGTINSQGLSTTFTFTNNTSYQWYCSQNSRNTLLQNVANLSFPSGETLFLDGVMTVLIGPFTVSGASVYTGPVPAYVPTIAVIAPQPAVCMGNTACYTATYMQVPLLMDATGSVGATGQIPASQGSGAGWLWTTPATAPTTVTKAAHLGVTSCNSGTGVSQYATCTDTITWPSAFADASYSVQCSGLGITSSAGNHAIILYPAPASTATATITSQFNATGDNQHFADIWCTATHP